MRGFKNVYRMSAISWVADGQGHHHQRSGLDGVDVFEQRGVQQVYAQARITEHRLDDHDAADQPVHVQHDDRDRRHQRVANGMLQHDAPVRKPFQVRRPDVRGAFITSIMLARVIRVT